MSETNNTADQLAAAVGSESGRELSEALKRITHCLGQLTDDQVWWRSDEQQNSIGNLILHLCGNLRQWIVAGLGGAKDVRTRPQEFSERGPISKAELVSRLQQVVREASTALSSMTAVELLRVRRIQGFDVTALRAIFESVPHFRGHTQEIIHITRHLIGDTYQFLWEPTTPEQRAEA
jgi:Protein of unknown function (DUF1572)